MIKIGVVNIDTSHPLEFASVLCKEDRARYVAIFNDGFRGEDEIDAFVKKFGLDKVCNSIEELAAYVDVGFVQGCNWDKHLDYAMAFIERNKPVFIDKPIVGNIADCRKLIELEKNGAVILGSSSVRYCNEIRNFVTLPENEKGEVLHIDITVGVDEFNYAIHAVEGMCALAGKKPVSVRYVGASHKENQTCETYFVEFEGGTTACYHCVEGSYVSFNVIIVTTVTSFHFRIDNGRLYKALLDQICSKLEGKLNCLAGMEEVTDSIKVSLAGKCSKENGGKTVEINSAELGNVSFDGAFFEKEYGVKAHPIYL
ncbi:MAG: Gfo/Idh/MocA family oxidoreductase [Clostridia bacterium]|nr:Gfo/Idh/MocA family oxidoreductase [Clostridia bacterium]